MCIDNEQLRSDIGLCAAVAYNSDSTSVWEAAKRVMDWLDSDASDAPEPTDGPTSKRDINGNVLTQKEVAEFERQGYRTYSVDCAYRLSHTRYFCHNNDCPEG